MDKERKSRGRNGAGISLRMQFGILFFLMMIGTILLGYLINGLFLEKYYVSVRTSDLVRVYDMLLIAEKQDLLDSDEFDETLQEALRRSNVSLLILDSSTKTDKVWSADETLMIERLYANLFGRTPILSGVDDPSQLKEVPDPSEHSMDGSADEGMDSGGEDTDVFMEYVITQTLDEGKSYIINVVLNQRSRTRSLEMWGPLGESRFFLLRSPLEDIRISAAAANRFFGYIGFALALAGTFLAWWLSSVIMKPIRQLTDISVRMSNLDFSAKYDGSGRSELDTLGKNMNDMSQKLEENIAALRTANNDLQRDLDRRNREEEMRQDFLANVTHELKTPLALIRGYAEGLQDGIADDPESRDFYLDTIIDESEKMNMIVQKVLMLNQLEFGDGSVSMENFDIADMIRNYLESASLLAQQENVSLRFEQDKPVFVWGDPFLIQEVFQNYYSNALHHVDFPSRVEVSYGGDGSDGTRKDEGAQGYEGAAEKVIDIRCQIIEERVRVIVFNTGRPIPEKSLPHIWEKFYKVDKARTRAYGGSGVGLSIVKAIMDLHHRAYGVENYDNGVAFWFELDHSGSGS